MQTLRAEWKKHRSFREAWVGGGLGLVYLLIALFAKGDYSSLAWYGVQQDIYSYGANLTAFLIVVGLSRLLCYEKEQKTDNILRTCRNGLSDTYWAKVVLAVEYCVIIVLLLGAASIVVNGRPFAYAEAFLPVTQCVYFDSVPLSNLMYCIIQYVFLLLGALYFAGFVLIIGSLVKRGALVIFICGGCYAVFMFYKYAGNYWLQGGIGTVCNFLYHYGFSGFMLQDSFSRLSNGGSVAYADWFQIWRPIVFVLAMICMEFALLWPLWRRRDRK